jgi:hypothetical protein
MFRMNPNTTNTQAPNQITPSPMVLESVQRVQRGLEIRNTRVGPDENIDWSLNQQQQQYVSQQQTGGPGGQGNVVDQQYLNQIQRAPVPLPGKTF